MRETWKSIPGEMFDFERYYSDIANRLPHGAKVCEVGIADGKSAIYLAETLANMNKDFHLTLVDNLDYGHMGQVEEIVRNIQKSGLADRMRLIFQSSLDASCKFPDEYFNFVFIDASHKYEETKADIRLWWRKIYPNGILAGHDALTNEEVNRAITQVIPSEFLNIVSTDKGYGVWQIKCSNGAHIRY